MNDYIYCDYCGAAFNEEDEALYYDDRLFCDNNCLDKYVEERTDVISIADFIEGEC